MKKLVKSLKTNKLLIWIEKIEIEANAKSLLRHRKQTFDFIGKIEIQGKNSSKHGK